MIISEAEEMNPTRRPTMEDCHVIHPAKTWNCGNENMTYLGVYDGHGGRDIVEFVQEHLSSNIAQELRRCDDDNDDDDDNNECDDDTYDEEKDSGGMNGNNVKEEKACLEKKKQEVSVLERMECGFLLTDIQSYQAGLLTSGATATVCIIEKHTPSIDNHKSNNNYTLYSANCGDARAVLSTNTQIQRLTQDHRASDIHEQTRIVNDMGGFVLRNRVSGVLAVSRSFGDHGLKEYVICRPFLKQVFIHGEKDVSNVNGFVILACDGLWDVMQDEDAVEFVKKYVRDGNMEGGGEYDLDSRRKNVAKMLIQEALKRGSGDNITVVVAWLSDAFTSS